MFVAMMLASITISNPGSWRANLPARGEPSKTDVSVIFWENLGAGLADSKFSGLNACFRCASHRHLLDVEACHMTPYQ